MKVKPKFSGIDSSKLNKDALLKTCLDPGKLSQVNNSFFVLQKTGNSTKSIKLKLQRSSRIKTKQEQMNQKRRMIDEGINA